MDDPVILEIVGSTSSLVKTKIRELYVPAHMGITGILEHHLPYITILDFGEVFYTDQQGNHHYWYIEDGFLEVNNNQVIIISDAIQPGSELKGDEIKGRLKEVTQKILDAKKGEISAQELDDYLEEEKRLKIKYEITQKLAKKGG